MLTLMLILTLTSKKSYRRAPYAYILLYVLLIALTLCEGWEHAYNSL